MQMVRGCGDGGGEHNGVLLVWRCTVVLRKRSIHARLTKTMCAMPVIILGAPSILGSV
jgi:hypothetical protein